MPITTPLSSIHHGTKFALEGLSESIQYELEPFGIKIILIEPGTISSSGDEEIATFNKLIAQSLIETAGRNLAHVQQQEEQTPSVSYSIITLLAELLTSQRK